MKSRSDSWLARLSNTYNDVGRSTSQNTSRNRCHFLLPLGSPLNLIHGLKSSKHTADAENWGKLLGCWRTPLQQVYLCRLNGQPLDFYQQVKVAMGQNPIPPVNIPIPTRLKRVVHLVYLPQNSTTGFDPQPSLNSNQEFRESHLCQ